MRQIIVGLKEALYKLNLKRLCRSIKILIIKYNQSVVNRHNTH